MNKNKLKIGDKVRFSGPAEIKGTVKEINEENATVDVYINEKACLFHVPYSMLTKEK